MSDAQASLSVSDATGTSMRRDEATAGGPISRARAHLRAFVTSKPIENTITGIIILNAITLGLETSDSVMAVWGDELLMIDKAVLIIFVVELILRMIAHGAAFWRDPWSLFDTAVVAVSLAPASEQFSVLRSLRIIRALRLISAFPTMRRVVEGLIRAIPSMGTVVMLLLLIFYVFSVMATKLYGDSFPEWFGTIGASSYTLFQIMTLEGWSDGIVRPVMEKHPYAWGFFVPFILITSFAVLNLFIGIIVDAMSGEHSETRAQVSRSVEDAEHEVEADIAQVLAEVRALRAEVASLKSADGGPAPAG